MPRAPQTKADEQFAAWMPIILLVGMYLSIMIGITLNPKPIPTDPGTYQCHESNISYRSGN